MVKAEIGPVVRTIDEAVKKYHEAVEVLNACWEESVELNNQMAEHRAKMTEARNQHAQAERDLTRLAGMSPELRNRLDEWYGIVNQ